jgi:penicillin amidase
MPKLERIRLPKDDAPVGLTITRDQHGVPHIQGPDLDSVLWGLGFCHALDRGLQLLLTRILGQGRGSECLAATAELLEVDRFFRRMNWRGNTQREVEKLSPAALLSVQSYTRGINAQLRRSVPWELRLVRHVPEPWTPADTILLSRVIGYVGLAQTQGDIERLFIEMVQGGVDDARLLALFPHIPEVRQLNGDDPRLPSRELLTQVRLGQRAVPAGVRWLSVVPRLTASNSWAIAPSRSRSGHALFSNDPHLEVNRLPNVWYEVVARILSERGHYVMTATMPGLPAPLLGRTRHLAWGATYTFMDAVDSWIEECRDGRYRRGLRYVEFSARREEIRQKGAETLYETFYENEHGVLDGDPHTDGYLLATRWAASESGARSVQSALAMWTATSVEQGMATLGQLETAWNWVLADRAGNIGYQMSGACPRRRPGVSGFVPLPGWYEENDWQGFLSAEELPRKLNPSEGFFVTANQDLNEYGSVPCQNATMASYRADRIRQLLKDRTDLDIETCRSIQYDTYSLQAELFMHKLRPLLPDSEPGRLLAGWDCRYDRESRGATLFERFYAELTHLIIGEYLIGPDVVAHLSNTTAFFSSFYKNVDPVLLDPPSSLCGGRAADALYRAAFTAAASGPIGPWGEQTKVTLKHLFLGGRLPRWLGFDRGPVSLAGGRATPCQTQLYTVGGREGCVAATVRLNADLGEDVLYTNLVGGPSDRRWSRWYCSGLEDWSNGVFKALAARIEP